MKLLRLVLPLGVLSLPLFFLTNFNQPIPMSDFISNSKYKIIEKIEDKSTYQIKSPIRLNKGWTCGLFTLFNAYKLEENLGLNSNLQFKEKCEEYLIPNKINPLKGTFANDLINIADQHLKLHNYHALHINKDGKVEPLLIDGVYLKWNLSSNNKDVRFEIDQKRHEIDIKGFAPIDTSDSKLDKLFHTEKNNQLQNILAKLKSDLDSCPDRKPYVIHFLCQIAEERHWILISVVKKPYEKPMLFLFDNMNHKISAGKSIKKYIDKISQMFCK